MDVVTLIIKIILVVFSLFLIAVVLLQSGKTAGLSGSIAGGAETFLGKGKSKGYDSLLGKLTKISAVGFILLSIGLVLIQKFAK